MIIDHQTTINDLKVYYRTAGNPEKQHLVFIHGWGGRSNGFLGNDKVIDELAKYFFVFAPELPGFMRSKPPREVWKVDDFSSFVDKLLQPLNLKNPIIMGQSFGGGVAALYAKLRNNDARCLILVDAVLSGRKENWYFKLRYGFPRVAKVINIWFIPLFLKKIIWSAYLGIPYSSLNGKNVHDYMVMAEFQASPYYIPRIDYQQIFVPLLLVWGDRDTWVSDMKRAKAIHREVTSSRFLIVKGPHTILYRNPNYVVGKIVDELDRMGIL